MGSAWVLGSQTVCAWASMWHACGVDQIDPTTVALVLWPWIMLGWALIFKVWAWTWEKWISSTACPSHPPHQTPFPIRGGCHMALSPCGRTFICPDHLSNHAYISLAYFVNMFCPSS